MKRIILILIGIFFLASCQRDKMTSCSSDIVKVPGYIGFYGIDTSDLDTIIVSKYPPNDSFIYKIDSDTIMTFHAVVDTGGYINANSIGQAFLGTSQGYDLGIYLPAIGKRFYIHAVYDPRTVWTYVVDDCGLDRTQVEGPEQLIANANVITKEDGATSFYFIQP